MQSGAYPIGISLQHLNSNGQRRASEVLGFRMKCYRQLVMHTAFNPWIRPTRVSENARSLHRSFIDDHRITVFIEKSQPTLCNAWKLANQDINRGVTPLVGLSVRPPGRNVHSLPVWHRVLTTLLLFHFVSPHLRDFPPPTPILTTLAPSHPAVQKRMGINCMSLVEQWPPQTLACRQR